MDTSITIRRPDDFHAHVRDGEMLKTVLPYTARDFARAIIMPNLVPAVRTVAAARAYRDRIIAALPENSAFTPLMTLYLTEETTPDEIVKAKESGFIHAFKNYPNGATTNSSEGVRDLRNVRKQLKALEVCGLPLLLHGEVTVDSQGRSIDPFDRERLFVETTLPWLMEEYLELKLVLEHITSEAAADYIETHGCSRLAATITPHHLISDRRALFEGGLNPHFYCLPILKRTADLKALRALATSGLEYVFAGTDTAPHPTHAKERACGCAAGCFVAPVALSMYAEVFEEEGASLPTFERFISENGARWYGLPLNTGTLTLVRSKELVIPEPILGGVRVYGSHTDFTKSMRWHWRVVH